MHSGVDTVVETELLRESPPFPHTLKFHPSNTVAQYVRAERNPSMAYQIVTVAGAAILRRFRQDFRTERDKIKEKVGRIPQGPKSRQLGDKAEGDLQQPKIVQAQLQSRSTSANQLLDF